MLIDTSAWTHTFRRAGNPTIKARVDALVVDHLAVWCDPIRLELWAGVRDDVERRALTKLETSVAKLEITDVVWDLACEIASYCRDKGGTFPANDLLIFACSQNYGARIEHVDKHYTKLEALWPLR